MYIRAVMAMLGRESFISIVFCGGGRFRCGAEVINNDICMNRLPGCRLLVFFPQSITYCFHMELCMSNR